MAETHRKLQNIDKAGAAGLWKRANAGVTPGSVAKNTTGDKGSNKSMGSSLPKTKTLNK